MASFSSSQALSSPTAATKLQVFSSNPIESSYNGCRIEVSTSNQPRKTKSCLPIFSSLAVMKINNNLLLLPSKYVRTAGTW